MLGKIAGIGLVVLLVGALLGGGAYILLRSDSGNGEAYQSGRGWQREAAADPGGSGQGVLEGGRGGGGGAEGSSGGRGGGPGRSEGIAGGESLSEWGGSGGQGQRGGKAQPAAPVDEVLTLVGTVIETEPELVLQTASGTVVVGLGPEWYRDAQGYTFAVGDQVEVTGFYEGETLEAWSIEDLVTGEVLGLRDGNGRPLWAGRGRGAGTY